MINNQPLKIQCLVVDDEDIAIKSIISYINRVPFLEVVDTCSTALEASEVLLNHNIDLIFLDINMPYLSGIDFLEMSVNERFPLTIITTAYSEYAIDGFRLQVVDYLLKPMSFQRFYQAVLKVNQILLSNKIVTENKTTLQLPVYAKQGNQYSRIEWSELLYIESMQNYLKLYCRDRTLTIHQTMAFIEDRAPKDLFFRIHRCYLVNLEFMKSISMTHIELEPDIRLPVSKQRREELFDKVVNGNIISR